MEVTLGNSEMLLLLVLAKLDFDSIGLPNKPMFSTFVSLAGIAAGKDPSELDPNILDTVWPMLEFCEVSICEKAELVTGADFCKLSSVVEKILKLPLPDAKELVVVVVVLLLLSIKAFLLKGDDPVLGWNTEEHVAGDWNGWEEETVLAKLTCSVKDTLLLPANGLVFFSCSLGEEPQTGTGTADLMGANWLEKKSSFEEEEDSNWFTVNGTCDWILVPSLDRAKRLVLSDGAIVELCPNTDPEVLVASLPTLKLLGTELLLSVLVLKALDDANGVVKVPDVVVFVKAGEETELGVKDVKWVVVPELKIPVKGLEVKGFTGWLTDVFVGLFTWSEKSTTPDLEGKVELENTEGFPNEEESDRNELPGKVTIVLKEDAELRFVEVKGFPVWRGVFAICPNEGSWLNTDFGFFGFWNIFFLFKILSQKKLFQIFKSLKEK